MTCSKVYLKEILTREWQPHQRALQRGSSRDRQGSVRQESIPYNLVITKPSIYSSHGPSGLWTFCYGEYRFTGMSGCCLDWQIEVGH